MIRVLHLVDADADFQTERGVLGLARALGADFATDTRRLGRGRYRNRAAAVLALRRESNFDIVHAWGPAALTVAAMASSKPIMYSPLPETRRRDVSWARAVMDYRQVEVICPTATLRRLHVERGVPLERCHLIRPGVEFGKIRRRRDVALRARLGFTDADHVLLTAGESTRAAAHTDAAWAASILHILDAKYRLLVWGRGRGAAKVKRFGDSFGRNALVTLAEPALGRLEFEELLPAADTILVSSIGATATLPISIAMAAGLPIVATVTYTTSELLEDRHTAVMAPACVPRRLARRVLDLHADTSLQWSISDMARTEAYELFSFTRFVEHFRTVYQQLAAGQSVVVPQQAAGAGLRFHGRA
ncbi:MAG TPA: glycosyltransferase [Tepidisphaeraceae bacterium]|nr:glycosyltransferase [Tepidisphaeraceae bacterium]